MLKKPNGSFDYAWTIGDTLRSQEVAAFQTAMASATEIDRENGIFYEIFGGSTKKPLKITF